jgi:hypothetical protein
VLAILAEGTTVEALSMEAVAARAGGGAPNGGDAA